MEVLVLVGLLIYGGYRLIKSRTPAARREREIQEKMSKETAASMAHIHNEMVERVMKDNHMSREAAEKFLHSMEMQGRLYEKYEREN